jgi:penicillin-binding protein 1A
MTEVTVCAQTGLLPGELCKELYTVKVPEGTAPVLTCDGHIYMSVCTESGCLANEHCPSELVQSVNTIDFASENVVNGMAYAREIILEPPTQKQVAEYEALLAAEPETETAAPTDTVITANDSGASYPDLVALGTCTLHEAPETVIEVPGFDWGFDFDDGSGLADEEEEEENAGFLNQLLGII